jgi:hypothetical protein
LDRVSLGYRQKRHHGHSAPDCWLLSSSVHLKDLEASPS